MAALANERVTAAWQERERPVSRIEVFYLCSIMDSADGLPAAPPHDTATGLFKHASPTFAGS
jgi:hypothetical protein